MKGRKSRLKRYVVAGLLVWVPAGVTFLVLRIVVNLMDSSLLLIPVAYRPESLIGFRIPGLGIILTLALLLVTGFFAANFAGRRLVGIWELVLGKIPLVSTIYTAAKKVSETVLSDRGLAFRKVILVEYPRRDLWSLAFVTARRLGEVQAKTGKEVLCVFVPTTPNPTSGVLVMVPRDEVIELDMAVDEAISMIISLGVVVPQWRGEGDVEMTRDRPESG